MAKRSREVWELDNPGLALTTRGKLLCLGERVTTSPIAIECLALSRHIIRGPYYSITILVVSNQAGIPERALSVNQN